MRRQNPMQIQYGLKYERRMKGNLTSGCAQCILRMPNGEARLHRQNHATAKTGRYSVRNLIDLVVNAGVKRGLNLN